MSRQEKQLTELKKRALLAKQRLKMGYWQSMTKEKYKALDEMGGGAASLILVKDLQQAKVQRDEKKLLNCSQATKEENFYLQVCSILDNNENATNPIGQLIDRDEYDRLDESNKQRYILELSKKFRDMRERYYQERLGKSC